MGCRTSRRNNEALGQGIGLEPLSFGATRSQPVDGAYNPSMTTLGALSQSWIAAEASLPLGWRLTGLMQFGGEWVAFSEGPGDNDHLEASGIYAYEALKRLSDRLRERRGPVTGASQEELG